MQLHQTPRLGDKYKIKKTSKFKYICNCYFIWLWPIKKTAGKNTLKLFVIEKIIVFRNVVYNYFP